MNRFTRLFGREAFRESTLLFIVAGIWVFFQAETDGIFLTQRNLVLLALQTSIVGLAAISAVMLIVTRNFDLSVGSAVALVGVVVAVLTVNHHVNPVLALGAALLTGLAMGAWQGLWVTRMRVSSFIVTLAGMLYFRGASMIATDGATVAPLPDSLGVLATGFLAPLPAIVLIVVALAATAAVHVAAARRAQQLGVLDGAVGKVVLRQMVPFAVGILVSAIVGYLAIAFMLRYLQTRTTYPFVYYRLALGIAVFLAIWTGIR